MWAGTVLALTLPRGRSLWGHRIALFLRADNTLYEAVNSRAVKFEFFDIYADMAANVERLAAYGPTILVGPPSVLRVIARLARDAGLDIAPERLISVAEVLDDQDRERLTSEFAVDVVHQLYQCTEGFLAHTCERGVLHLNESLVMIEREYLDERRFVPIITDLVRRAQPIVRYRLNDILVDRATPCPCGSARRALERIEGREDDTLTLRRSDGTTVDVFADMITRAMVYAHGFENYRVTQTGPARLVIEIDVLDTPARDSVENEIAALCTALDCELPALEFRAYRTDLTKKLRRVERAWGDDESV
jgi:putative adenylate-forming enzyme